MPDDIAPHAPAAGADDLTMAAGAAANTTHLPTSIASFRIIRLIGAGGMGAVYEAEQAMPRRIVALKVIRPGLVTPDLRRRFEHEVQVLGRLQHPGIAQIYQAGVTDLGGGPQPFFAMELVSGLPLTDFVRRAGLDVRSRLQLLARICDAVQHAHQRGIIHRDLKPGNILVEQGSSEPKILDFGIARTTDPNLEMTAQTLFGQIVGTLPYMSPEQLAADPAGVDTRTDVYALGVILYELLTGKLPHDLTHRSTLDAMTVIRDLEPTRVGTLDRRLRGDIETIVAKALEKERDRRYGSAAELAADIRRYLDDQPIVARPPSAAYQLRKFARRNKVLVGGVVCAFVILAAGIVASTWQAVRATRAERLAGTRLVEADQARAVAQTRAMEATEARQLADQRRAEAEANFDQAQEARTRAEQQREANRQLLYVSDLNLAQRLWNEGDYPRLVDLLGRHQAQPGMTDLRGFEWFHLWHATHLHRREFQLSSFIEAVTATPDGQTIAAGDASGDIGVWNTSTGRRVLTLKGLPVNSVALSEDGRRLAVGSRTGIVRAVDATSGREIATFSSEKPAAVSRLQFTGDGRALYASMGATTRVWDLATTRELLHAGPGMFVPSASEPRVLIPRTPTNVVIWSPAGEQPVAIAGRFRDAAVSGDGSRVIVMSGDGTITVASAAGEVMQTFRPDQAYTPLPVASKTGRLLAVRTPMAVLIIDVDAGKTLASVTASSSLRRVAFSPNEQVILLSDDTGITLFDVPGRRIKAIVRGHATVASAMQVASDDRTLITAASDSIKVWDLASVSPVERLSQGPGMVDDIAVSLDGRSLAAATYVSSTAGTSRTTIAVWDLASGRQIASRQFADRAVAVAFAAGSTVVAGDPRGKLLFWSLDQNLEPLAVAAHGGLVRSIRRSADGTRVASAGGGEVRVWDVTARRLVTTLPHREVRATAFAPDGSRLATAGFDRVIRIWTLGGSATPREIPGPGQGVWSLAWSSDGRLLASADETGGVYVWRVSDGTVVARLRAHTERATVVSFSRDGRRLLTGSTDGLVRLWDVETWSEVAQFNEQTDSITAAAFALGGNAIVAGTGVSAVLMWRAADRAR